MKPHPISYTHITWGPWRGCTPVSPGYKNCYAAAMARRFNRVPGGPFEGVEYKAGVPRRKTSDWQRPFALDCKARRDGVRYRIFPSMCDWLDPEVPAGWLADFLCTINATQDVTWLLLTKRPELFVMRLSAVRDCTNGEFPAGIWLSGQAPPNIWIGTTVEHQATDWRIPYLLKIPARVRFLSVEPMIGPVEFTGEKLEWLAPFKDTDPMLHKTPRIDWVICGGESGPNARPMDPDWARSLYHECFAAGTAFFMKQMARREPIPADLQIQQFPNP